MSKRLFDISCSVIALIILYPLLAIIAIVIKFDSRGPIFYRGVRTGLYGQPFRIYKFRTMVVGAEKKGGASTALNDPRLTKIGRFLRKYKLDELPQLINILCGEMSFVGPRPQVEKYTRLYNNEEKVMLTVKPGLTDYASIKFINMDLLLGNGPVDEKYAREIEPEKNRLRIRYAKEHSMVVDIRIILRTILNLFKAKSHGI